MNVSMALRKINVGLEAKYVCESYLRLKVPHSEFRQRFAINKKKKKDLLNVCSLFTFLIYSLKIKKFILVAL